MRKEIHFKLSNEQMEAIKAAEKDIIAGRITSDEEVNIEEDKWLEEKNE